MGVDRAFFTTGSKVQPYDIENDVAVDEQQELGELWGGMPPQFAAGLDAALDFGTSVLYVLRGGEYVRIPFATQTVDDGYPLPLAGNWKGLSFQTVDAAMNWGD